MPGVRFRDVIEELECRRISEACLACEAGVSMERVAFWVRLAELARAQSAEEDDAGVSCSR